MFNAPGMAYEIKKNAVNAKTNNVHVMDLKAFPFKVDNISGQNNIPAIIK